MLSKKNIESMIPEKSATYDVIVAGGGPAGIGAAVASAQRGARTLLLEGNSFFGGVAMNALWMPVVDLMVDGTKRGGIHDQFIDAIKKYGADAYRDTEDKGKEGELQGANIQPFNKNFTEESAKALKRRRYGLRIHPEYLRLAAFELLEEANCHYRLYSPVTGVIMDGNVLKGVEVATKEGPQRFYAKVIVDATGDGDVSNFAGVETKKGREEDGLFLPVSLVFALGNVDVQRFLHYTANHREEFSSIVIKAAEEGYCTSVWYSFTVTTLPGVVNVNNGGVYGIGNVDASNERDLTVAERMGVQMATDFVRLGREKRIPGLENCTLMRAGARVAVRDTRRIVGDYVVTVEDARTGPEFEDTICRKYGLIDANQLFIGSMVSGYACPYRSLLPRQVENLLVAGRCSSATHLGFAAGKSMGNMMGLGQAAGVAAAVCCAGNVSPRQVDVKEIQAILASMGVAL